MHKEVGDGEGSIGSTSKNLHAWSKFESESRRDDLQPFSVTVVGLASDNKDGANVPELEVREITDTNFPVHVRGPDSITDIDEDSNLDEDDYIGVRTWDWVAESYDSFMEMVEDTEFDDVDVRDEAERAALFLDQFAVLGRRALGWTPETNDAANDFMAALCINDDEMWSSLPFHWKPLQRHYSRMMEEKIDALRKRVEERKLQRTTREREQCVTVTLPGDDNNHDPRNEMLSRVSDQPRGNGGPTFSITIGRGSKNLNEGPTLMENCDYDWQLQGSWRKAHSPKRGLERWDRNDDPLLRPRARSSQTCDQDQISLSDPNNLAVECVSPVRIPTADDIMIDGVNEGDCGERKRKRLKLPERNERLDKLDIEGVDIYRLQVRDDRIRQIFRMRQLTAQSSRQILALRVPVGADGDWNGNEAEIPDDLAIMATATLNGHSVETVLDTGAQVTVISAKLHRRLGSPRLTPINCVAQTANETRLQLLGAMKIDVSLGGKLFPFYAWVAQGLSTEMLLGLDFANHYGAKIDLEKVRFTLRDVNVPITLRKEVDTLPKGGDWQPKVAVIQSTTLEPNHTYEVPVRLQSRIPKKGYNWKWEFKPSELNQHVQLARGIVDPKASEFRVIMVNTGSQPYKLETGYVVGKLGRLSGSADICSLSAFREDQAENAWNIPDLWSTAGGSNVPNSPPPAPDPCSNMDENVRSQNAEISAPDGHRAQMPDRGQTQHNGAPSDAVAGDNQMNSGGQRQWDDKIFTQRVIEILQVNNGLSDEQRDQLLAIMLKHKRLWISGELGQMDYVYDIEVQPWQPPVKQGDRRWSPGDIGLIRKEIGSLLEGGFIEPAKSPWASRLVLVPKKDGSVRVCVDYRQLNDVTITDAYPTPRVSHVIENLGRMMFFTCLDCEKGYYQIRLSEKTKDISAFICPMGQFRWTRMPFGFKNAPAVFQRLMDLILSGLSWECCMVFFDDVIVFSATWDAHMKDLDRVFQRMEDAGLTLNFKKCEFAKTSLVYLGHLISKDGIRPDPKKTQAVRDFRVPSTVAEMRSFLGIASYFRKFIKNYARIAKPLHDLISCGSGKAKDKTSITASWTADHQNAFNTLKGALTSDSLLGFPDLSKPFALACDSSDFAVGAILTQLDEEGRERPIEYASRALSPREQKYPVHEREALALVFGMTQFRHYLHGLKFKAITDNAAVQFLIQNADPKGRVARWVLMTQEFTFDVIHKPGASNLHADALSRLVEHILGERDEIVGDAVPEDDFVVTANKVTVWEPNVNEVTLRQKNGAIPTKPSMDACSMERMDEGGSDVMRKVTGSDTSTEKDAREVYGPARILLEDWKSAQHMDPQWRVMTTWLVDRVLTKDHPEWHRWILLSDSQFELVQGVLCRRVQLAVSGHTLFRLVPIVPQLFREKVALFAHVEACAHSGVNRTYDWMRRRFWWPGYFGDLKKLIQQCTTCQSKSGSPGQHFIEGRIPVSRPFEVWGIDRISLPASEEGLDGAIVVVDHHARFAWVEPTRGKDAEETLGAYMKVESHAQAPEILLSDNGSEFKNAKFEQYCKANGIKQHFVIPYHPQSDGIVERFNRTLIAMLMAYVNEAGTDWPKFLAKVVAAYNSMSHSTTGAAPYAILFGQDKPAPIFSLKGGNEVCDPNEFEQLKEWVNEYRKVTQEKSDDAENAKRSLPATFKVGDLVWCLDYWVGRTKEQRPHKLQRKWCGPWTVHATWGNVTLTLKRVGGKEMRRAHVDQLKPFVVSKHTPRSLKRAMEPVRPTAGQQKKFFERQRREGVDHLLGEDDDISSDDGLSTTEYKVETIDGHFLTDRGFWFLIKWEDFSEKTWEHESMVSAPEKVTQYFRKVCQSMS